MNSFLIPRILKPVVITQVVMDNRQGDFDLIDTSYNNQRNKNGKLFVIRVKSVFFSTKYPYNYNFSML